MTGIDFNNLEDWKGKFKGSKPFDHVIIDNFLNRELAESLESEFPIDRLQDLYSYNNPLENKFASNNWNLFSPKTYEFFEYLNSAEVVEKMSILAGVKLIPDYGLHGGGWHIHGDGGKLNPHLDYSIHPKLGLQRKLNLIIYLSSNWKDEYGGHLGLWNNNTDTSQPANMEQEVSIGFNKALIFDTTQMSWHGISQEVKAPVGLFRKSLAIYYLCEPAIGALPHGRALYAPTADQKENKEIMEMIQKRVDVQSSSLVYRTQ